ncbi:MAG: hypothetical protein QNI99_00500 [Woeseiaceae bacterium]|nr:hypothetical protein [Woeseiaceae bacterium]
MTEQPIPDVSFEDVERIVDRDFQPGDRAALRRIIGESDVGEKARVILACLKLADGDLARAEDALNGAAADWRDAISAAEYPNYLRLIPPTGAFSDEQRQRVFEEDWDQYSTWLYAEHPVKGDSGS